MLAMTGCILAFDSIALLGHTLRDIGHGC